AAHPGRPLRGHEGAARRHVRRRRAGPRRRAGLGAEGAVGAVGHRRGAPRCDALRERRVDALTDDAPVRAAGETAARASYGRLLALLAARDGDIARAEDALAGAFEQALRRWPEDGVPGNPDGWLLTVARNRLRDLCRSAAHRTAVPPDAGPEPAAPPADLDPDAIGDRRLELLFVCAHPAVEAGVRTPLMLQTVLGVEARD